MFKHDALFAQYYKRMVREGILTAAAYGLMIGAGAVFAAALACWLLHVGTIFLPLAVGAAVFLISAVLLYSLKFHPSDRDIARRIDRMGLEERTVTMLGLSKDESYMARVQRADTRERVEAVDRKQIRTAFPLLRLKTWAVFTLCAVLMMSAGMVTVMGLTDSGVLPSPDILPTNEDRQTFFTVTYLTEGDGDILGEMEQAVPAGTDAQTVVAMPADGWVFVKWSDGVKDPARTDRALSEDLEVTAVFEEIADGGDGEDGDDSANDDEAGDDKNVPDDNKTDGSSAAGSNGGEGGEGNDSGDKGDGNGKGDGGQQGDGKGNGRGDGAGGGWSEGNQIIDGKINYRDVYDSYYDQAMEIIRNGGELPDYLKEFIEKYYGSI